MATVRSESTARKQTYASIIWYDRHFAEYVYLCGVNVIAGDYSVSISTATAVVPKALLYSFQKLFLDGFVFVILYRVQIK